MHALKAFSEFSCTHLSDSGLKSSSGKITETAFYMQSVMGKEREEEEEHEGRDEGEVKKR